MALTAQPAATLRQQVLDTIQEHGLCRKNDTVIVAVSGGADSVALLDLLATLPGFPLNLIAAHLNHCLRGEESDADERFVAALATSRTIPLETCRVDVRALAGQKGLSLEEAGREARYLFFEQLRRKHNAAAIATAHHSDDQAETFLIRLLRGSGIDGLACIPYRNKQGVIRPLLDISRQELRRYLEERGLQWHEDASNQDRSFLRNRIRLELLPLLADYSPKVTRTLAATAALMQQEQHLLDRCVNETFSCLARLRPGSVFLPYSGCSREPAGMRFRLYRQAVASVAGNLRRFGQEHIRQLDRLLLEGSTGARLPLPGGLAAVRTADGLLLSSPAALAPAPPQELVITGPGSYDLGNGLALLVEEPAGLPQSSASRADSVLVDSGAAPFPWLVRPLLPGDRMTLPGGSGSRSARRILIDLKIPAHLRPLLPLVLAGGRPLWLAGVRRSGHAPVQPGTTKLVRLSISGLENLPAFPAP